VNEILRRIEREMKHKRRTPAQVWTRRITLILLLILTPLPALELGLRLSGYSRPQIDLAGQGKTLEMAAASLNKRFQTDAFVPDPFLLWHLRKGANLYGLTVADDGTLDNQREHAAPLKTRHDRIIRVLCLGDSVTAITYRTYPETAARLSDGPTSGPGLISWNAAVPGYTTEQAIRWLPELADVKPDVVVICFGWNDHFPAINLPDRELGTANAGSRFFHNMLKDVRVYQLLGAPLGTKSSAERDSGGELASDTKENVELRVSPKQFRANLEQLVKDSRQMNAMPILVTEPENLDTSAIESLKKNRFLPGDIRQGGSLHHQYNQIIREAAAKTHAPLMDLEEEFVRRQRDYMFEPDGIHLTGKGHNHVARLLLGLLRDEGKITAAEYDAIAAAEKHDTTAPDKPRAAYSLIPPHVDAVPAKQFQFSVVAQNAGNTRWLKEHVIPMFGLQKNVSYGSVTVGATWRTVNSPVRGVAARIGIPSDILPGEATSVTLGLNSPANPGNYELEVGLFASHLGPLKNYGAETTTLTVTVH
jgi:lysophospholipase L1-like esterase